jgi:DnaJ-class molecular chaperone
MTDPRIVECPRCGGEGRLYDQYTDWQHGPGEIDVGRCEECEGAGELIPHARTTKQTVSEKPCPLNRCCAFCWSAVF